MSEPILEAVDVAYRYPAGDWALRGVDLVVRRGERVAILGANGSGKTTLLLHLNGILRPQRGSIRLDGRPVRYGRRDLIAWRTQVGLVFQNPDDQLFSASVVQDVSFGPLNLGLEEAAVRERVDEALRAMGIETLRDRPVHMLSFGQKKRVAIAGVVAMRPTVLLLDEPTAGLDPGGTEALLTTLEALHADGATLVFATHDLELAYSWADTVVVLDRGRIAGAGPPETTLLDDAMLRRCGLRRPFLVDVLLALRESGAVPEGSTPRTKEALLALLRGLSRSEGVSEGDPPPGREG